MQTHNFVVIAKAPIERVAGFAKDRGWKHLKLLSSTSNRFKNDYGAEDHDLAEKRVRRRMRLR
jgi:predicted dithiol-disulfide oxidoreductase (DUF899 family)